MKVGSVGGTQVGRPLRPTMKAVLVEIPRNWLELRCKETVETGGNWENQDKSWR